MSSQPSHTTLFVWLFVLRRLIYRGSQSSNSDLRISATPADSSFFPPACCGHATTSQATARRATEMDSRDRDVNSHHRVWLWLARHDCIVPSNWQNSAPGARARISARRCRHERGVVLQQGAVEGLIERQLGHVLLPCGGFCWFCLK